MIRARAAGARRARFVARYGVALLVGANLVGHPAAAGEPVAPTEVAEVVVRRASRACFARLIHAAGYLVPRESAVVMLNAPGYRITEVRAKVGAAIKRGDVVARAVPSPSPSATPADDKPAAAADVVLVAPAGGTILQSTAFVGQQTTSTSKPLVTIAVDGAIEAAVAVPSVHVLDLQVGQAALVTMGDGHVLHGRVRRVPATIDPLSQMGTARLSIEPGGALVPGLFVPATIEARRSCGIGVPITALQRTSAGPFVQVVVDDVITRRAVVLGLADETDSEVTSGVAEGEIIVASAGASRDGDRVRPVLVDPQESH